MKATDIIKDIMVKQGIKPSELAFKLEIRNNTLSERMTQKNLSILKLSEMLRAMNYKILVVPRNTRLPEQGYELTMDNEEPKKMDSNTPSSDDEPSATELSKQKKTNPRVQFPKNTP